MERKDGRDLMLRNSFKRIGFVGLGNMGARMCSRLLLLENELYVYDVSEEAVINICSKGAKRVDRLSDMSKICDIILMSLPNNKIVDQVFFGENGLTKESVKDVIFVDFSSSTPETTKNIGDYLSDKQSYIIDAPVSRGASAAEEGTLSIMIGGDRDIQEKVMFILKQLGTDIMYTGDLGSAHMVKALNNFLSASNLVTAIEGFTIAKKYGIEPTKFTEAINKSSGKSHMTTVRFPKYYLPRKFNSNFSIGLMHKDMSIALEVARKSGIPMLYSSFVQDIYALAISKGWGLEDNTKIMQIVEDLMGYEEKKNKVN